MRSQRLRIGLAVALALALMGGAVYAVRTVTGIGRMHVVAYFDNSNGLFGGDEVRILGVPVGAIDTIEPQAERVKVTFWVDRGYQVPADARAVIISPQLVTARAIQLTPVYTEGAAMRDGAIIPQSRTAVPLEWDDLRQQLEKLTDALEPTEPGGVSTLGAYVDTAAANLRGEGTKIHDTIIEMSQAISALGDHSDDMFSTIKNLSVVVSALTDSSTLLRELNQNFAAVTAVLTQGSGGVGKAVKDLHDVIGEATRFISDNREALGTSTDRLASITSALHESLDDIEQSLHMFPNTFQNFVNIMQPTQQGFTGALAVQNFANPISFLCGAIQAASRLNSAQAAKLCVQYLAPIVKNRQYNFLPWGENLFVGGAARPNEISYSEDWLRPDHLPTQLGAPAPVDVPAPAEATPPGDPPPAAAAVTTDPAGGLPAMMVPSGGGS